MHTTIIEMICYTLAIIFHRSHFITKDITIILSRKHNNESNDQSLIILI